MKAPAKTIDEIIINSLYSDEDYILPPALFTIKGKTILTENNFITISGLPKTRKTTFMQFFVASILTGQKIMEIESTLPSDSLVVLVDTEQSKFDFYRQVKFLKKEIKKNKLPTNFQAYLFREYEPQVMISAIEDILEKQKPKILFIDNLTSLAINPNDIIECSKIAKWLMKITAKYNCGIVNLIHLSKGGINTLGHLGAYADRNSQSVLKVTINKDTDTSTIEADRMRSDAHFEPITIQYSTDENKYILADNPTSKPKKEKFDLNNFTDAEITGAVEILFEMTKQDRNNGYASCVEKLGKIFQVGDNAAKKILIELQEQNRIRKQDKQYFKVEKQLELIKPKKAKK